MSIEITMPRLSDTMEEGTLIKWRVKVGDKVSAGDVLADVETDKATMELEAFDDGAVAHLAVNEGDTTPVGQLILVMAEEDENIEQVMAKLPAVAQTSSAAAANATAVSSGGGTATIAATPPPETPTPAAPTQQTGPVSGRLRISSVASKIAEAHGLDLSTVQGSGPDGRIIKRDVLAHIEPTPASDESPVVAVPTPVPSPRTSAASVALRAQTVPLSNMRKTIARRLLESKTTIPHWTVTVSIDMDPLLELRATVNRQLETDSSEGAVVKLSVNDFIVRASGGALRQHPAINASWAEISIQQHGMINIGVAVALPAERGGGLVVPTIRDVENISLRQISAETKRLAKKAREQGLTAEEMSDGTFTVSNLGMFGVEHFEAIINPPQAAILAVGAAIEKPVVRDGQVRVGREMSCTLSADHRLIDGAMAAEFMQTLKQLLETPAVMLV